MPGQNAMFVKVRKEAAESVKKLLMHNNVMDRQRYVKHSQGYVLFPIVDIDSERIKKLLKGAGASIIKGRGRKKEAGVSYQELLRPELSSEELKAMVKGYDSLGNIVIIEVPAALRSKRRLIADAILKANKNVETVLEKAGPVSGVYRTRSVRYVAGKRGFIARYRENNCLMVFDVRKVFFSNRLSFERQRIASLVGDGENVVVMFAGVGPFVLEIAKAHRHARVIGIEINKYACDYMRKNITINKLDNAKAVCGDVKKVYRKYIDYADRVVMPLPKDSSEFIKEAVAVAKRSAMIHVYTFCRIGGAGEAARMLKRKIADCGATAELVSSRVVRPYSAAEEEIVLDLRIKKRTAMRAVSGRNHRADAAP